MLNQRTGLGIASTTTTTKPRAEAVRHDHPVEVFELQPSHPRPATGANVPRRCGCAFPNCCSSEAGAPVSGRELVSLHDRPPPGQRNLTEDRCRSRHDLDLPGRCSGRRDLPERMARVSVHLSALLPLSRIVRRSQRFHRSRPSRPVSGKPRRSAESAIRLRGFHWPPSIVSSNTWLHTSTRSSALMISPASPAYGMTPDAYRRNSGRPHHAGRR